MFDVILEMIVSFYDIIMRGKSVSIYRLNKKKSDDDNENKID